ncbi:MAG: S41 family peptidase [bacterium]|nr:S41 family peptidase [bacterium]
MPKKKRRFIRNPRAVITAVAAGLLIYAVGFSAGKYGIPPRQYEAGDTGAFADYSEFYEAKQLIEDRHVGEVDPQELVDAATDGLVNGLDDPYSDYLTPSEVQELEDSLSGEVEGIGIEIGVRDERVVVIAPLPDSPAARAGIRAGDRVVGVGDTPTVGLTVSEVADRIRGEAGTEVRVTVQTPGAQPRELTITRAQLKAPSVSLEFQGDVAVLEVSRFGDATTEELEAAAAEILERGSRGVILDLRSNPGGFLDGAIEAAALFLDEGVVVKERFKDKTEERSVSNGGRLAGVPAVVLVNEGTASASEILAGALRDNRDVPLVGQKTFGKGSVQDLIGLDDGAVLKLTIAEWLTPSGQSLAEDGLEPDIAVPSDDPAAQLRRAIEAL